MNKPANGGKAKDDQDPGNDNVVTGAKKPLSPAAQRALAEAAERRKVYDAEQAELTKKAEINGRKGPEPIRYGDWEKDGIISDF